MTDLYITKTTRLAFLNSSRFLVLVEKGLEHTLKDYETEHWGCLSLQILGNDLLIASDISESAQELEKIESLDPHIIAVVFIPASLLRNSFTGLDFAQKGPLPMIEAHDAAQILGNLLGHVCNLQSTTAAALASEIHRVAAIQTDLDRSEEISAAALQTLGLRALGKPKLVFSQAPVHDGQFFFCSPAQPPIRQSAPVSLANLSAVSVHIAEAACGDGSSLTVRLVSVENQISHGSWVVPAKELKPGWLVLDLRSVIGPMNDTAALEILPLLSSTDSLAFSLSAEEYEHRLSVGLDHVLNDARALCLQFFTAEFGSRNVLPRYWNWEDCRVARPFVHVPYHLPSEVWLVAELTEGDGEFVAIGADPPRPVVRVAPGRRAVVKLPNCAFENCDIFEVGLSIFRSPSNFVRVRFLLDSLNYQGGVESTTRSEWMLIGGSEESARFAGRLPASVMLVNLSLEVELARGQGLVTLEWTSVTGLKLPVSDLGRQDVTLEAVEPTLISALSEEGRLDVRQIQTQNRLYAGVKVDHVFSNEAGTYRHIDLLIYDFLVGQTLLPLVRFKLAEVGGLNVLEFRSGLDWPAMFEIWPTTASDAYGPVFYLESDLEQARRLLSKLTATDRVFLTQLCEILPKVVASAARDAAMDQDATAGWIAAAHRFSQIANALSE